jgi:sulfotransferase
MYMALESAMSRRNETAVFIGEGQRPSVLKGLFSSYYEGIHDDRLVFDTNRAWCTRLSALTQLFPDGRFICCVRDVGWIMDSIERLVRHNASSFPACSALRPAGPSSRVSPGLHPATGWSATRWMLCARRFSVSMHRG